MPQFVRNFWLKGTVGDKSITETGPRSASEGIDLTVLIREDGHISDRSLRIVGTVKPDGRLVLEAYEEGTKEGRVVIATLK